MTEISVGSDQEVLFAIGKPAPSAEFRVSPFSQIKVIGGVIYIQLRGKIAAGVDFIRARIPYDEDQDEESNLQRAGFYASWSLRCERSNRRGESDPLPL